MLEVRVRWKEKSLEARESEALWSLFWMCPRNGPSLPMARQLCWISQHQTIFLVLLLPIVLHFNIFRTDDLKRYTFEHQERGRTSTEPSRQMLFLSPVNSISNHDLYAISHVHDRNSYILECDRFRNHVLSRHETQTTSHRLCQREIKARGSPKSVWFTVAKQFKASFWASLLALANSVLSTSDGG